MVPRKVLVVDDNDDAADSLADVLRLAGHDVQVAYNGVTAIEKNKQFAPDVVILDLALPTMDGFEIARRIRRERGHDELRLIAVTGYGQDDDRRSTRDAGFDYHVTKPPDLEVLLSLIADDGRKYANAR